MKVYLPPHEISLEIRIEIQNFPPISQTVHRIQKIRKSWKGREQRDGKMDTREENEREDTLEKYLWRKIRNVPDRIPCISIARKVGRELSKWNDLFAAALHPGPFANYKREPWRIPSPSGLSCPRPFLPFSRRKLCAVRILFHRDTVQDYFLCTSTKFVSLPMAPVDYKDRSFRRGGGEVGGGGPFVTRLSSSYPRKSYLVPRFHLSLSLLSVSRLLPRPPSPFSGELIGDGCGRCSIGN